MSFVIVLFAAGLMAKPMLVTLPLILLLVDFWPLRRFSLSAANENSTVSFSRAITEIQHRAGVALMRLGRVDEAIAHYRNVLTAEPGLCRGRVGIWAMQCWNAVTLTKR